MNRSSVSDINHKDCTKRVVKRGGGGGGSRPRFTENKTVLSEFTKDKIGFSRFTEKNENVFL